MAVKHMVEVSLAIATTDLVAMGVYRALQDRGALIPRDISVVGFDNIYFSRFLSPPLTTVDVSRVEMSRLVLQSLIGDRHGELLRVSTRLVLRGSTQASG